MSAEFASDAAHPGDVEDRWPEDPDAVFLRRELDTTELAAYARDGFLRYGPILTAEGLKRMRAACLRAWEREKGPFRPEGTWLQNALLPDVHHRSAFVRAFYFEGPLVSVATQLLGPDIKAATSQLTFKMRGNEQEFGWHQDNSYGELDPYDAISCLVALDDADTENGCLWIVPGSHRLGQIPLRRSLADQRALLAIDLEVDADDAIPVPLRAGECLFFHGHTLHRSEGNRSRDRDRRLLFLRYAHADAVEVYNDRRPRLGRLLRGRTRFPEVERFEREL